MPAAVKRFDHHYPILTAHTVISSVWYPTRQLPTLA